MSFDPEKRPPEAVVACLLVKEGEARLIFDDVMAENGKASTSWTFRTHFTRNDYDAKKVLDSELTDEQYQEIGFNLMARLGAIYKTSK